MVFMGVINQLIIGGPHCEDMFIQLYVSPDYYIWLVCVESWWFQAAKRVMSSPHDCGLYFWVLLNVFSRRPLRHFHFHNSHGLCKDHPQTVGFWHWLYHLKGVELASAMLQESSIVLSKKTHRFAGLLQLFSLIQSNPRRYAAFWGEAPPSDWRATWMLLGGRSAVLKSQWKNQSISENPWWHIYLWLHDSFILIFTLEYCTTG